MSMSRDTQELMYTGHVSSDLNPSEMFIGSELEFNSMTKYFYTDRTLPKKRPVRGRNGPRLMVSIAPLGITKTWRFHDGWRQSGCPSLGYVPDSCCFSNSSTPSTPSGVIEPGAVT